MRKSIFTLVMTLFVANAGFVSTAWADTFVSCSHCSLAQMKQQARNMFSGDPLVHVIDFSGAVYKSFFVEVIDEPTITRTIVQLVPTPPETVPAIEQAIDIFTAIKQASANPIPISDIPFPAQPGSAIDVVGDWSLNRGLERAVGLYLSANTGRGDSLFITNALAGLFQRSLEVELDATLSVLFPDGSQMNFEVVSIGLDQERYMVFGLETRSATAPNGRVIPQDRNQFNGFSHTPTDGQEFNRWTDLMRRLGIPVVEGSGQAPGGTTGGQQPRFECSIEGNEIKCRVVYPT